MRFIHHSGQESQLHLIIDKLRHVSGPLYTARIGFLTLNNLGYTIAFHRPRHNRLKKRITYHIMPLTPMTRQLASELSSSNMKTGILSMLSRGCRLLASFRQLDSSGYNLPLHKYRFSLVSIYYLDSENNTLDCITERRPRYHHEIISREYPLDNHQKK